MKRELNGSGGGSKEQEKEEAAPTANSDVGEEGKGDRQDEGNEKGEEGSSTAAAEGDGVASGEEKEDEGKKEVMVEYLPLDLSSFQCTTECVRLFREKGLPLHILINNAAVAWVPFGK